MSKEGRVGKEVEEGDKVGWEISDNITIKAWDKWDEGKGQTLHITSTSTHVPLQGNTQVNTKE